MKYADQHPEAKAAMAELARLVRHPFDPTESGTAGGGGEGVAAGGAGGGILRVTGKFTYAALDFNLTTGTGGKATGGIGGDGGDGGALDTVTLTVLGGPLRKFIVDGGEGGDGSAGGVAQATGGTATFIASTVTGNWAPNAPNIFS